MQIHHGGGPEVVGIDSLHIRTLPAFSYLAQVDEVNICGVMLPFTTHMCIPLTFSSADLCKKPWGKIEITLRLLRAPHVGATVCWLKTHLEMEAEEKEKAQ